MTKEQGNHRLQSTLGTSTAVHILKNHHMCRFSTWCRSALTSCQVWGSSHKVCSINPTRKSAELFPGRSRLTSLVVHACGCLSFFRSIYDVLIPMVTKSVACFSITIMDSYYKVAFKSRRFKHRLTRSIILLIAACWHFRNLRSIGFM